MHQLGPVRKLTPMAQLCCAMAHCMSRSMPCSMAGGMSCSVPRSVPRSMRLGVLQRPVCGMVAVPPVRSVVAVRTAQLAPALDVCC